jgi:hypothetical protein
VQKDIRIDHTVRFHSPLSHGSRLKMWMVWCRRASGFLNAACWPGSAKNILGSYHSTKQLVGAKSLPNEELLRLKRCWSLGKRSTLAKSQHQQCSEYCHTLTSIVTTNKHRSIGANTRTAADEVRLEPDDLRGVGWSLDQWRGEKGRERGATIADRLAVVVNKKVDGYAWDVPMWQRVAPCPEKL